MKNTLWIGMLGLFLVACDDSQPVQRVKRAGEGKGLEVQTSEMHKEWIKEDIEAIDKYVQRRGWKMEETGTGTLFFIYEESEGEKGAEGRMATVAYEISLLDGTICYTSDEDGPATVRIDKDDVESGMHEVLKIMKVGEKAAVILHPHRAHGLVGDLDKIGPASVVIYNLHLIELK